MSAKRPSMSDERRRTLLCREDGAEIRGNKKEWESVYGPGYPFGGGFETTHPNKALRAGVEQNVKKKR
jgi:hypothetical protein